jgi:hypothetical protein
VQSYEDGCEKGQKISRDYAEVLIRHDIQEHLIKMHLLYERTNVIATLANTYIPDTQGFQAFSLYHLAMHTNQDAEHSKKEDTDTHADVGRDMCLRGLQGTQWMQTAARVLRNVEKDFDKMGHAGFILVELVTKFGMGILLTCAVKAHQS